MSLQPPRLLFAPVSGPRGMGEYARCLALAQACAVRWPQAQQRFLLSRDAPYIATCPFPVISLPASVTLSSPESIDALEQFRPHVAIYDNAGRTRQFARARLLGTALVYVSSRSRQRRKGFRLGWMRAIAEHWIAYPEALVEPLGLLERTKLRMLGRPTLRFLDTLLPTTDVDGARARLPASPTSRSMWPELLVVPGGGSAHPGAEDLPAAFVSSAATLARAGHDVALVAGPALASRLPKSLPESLRCVVGLDSAGLRALIENARLVITNGGDTLVQALALGRTCVAVPIAADQRERVARCAALGVVAAPAIGDIEATVEALLAHPQRLEALGRRVEALGWRNRMDDALDAIGALLPPACQPVPAPSARASESAGATR